MWYFALQNIAKLDALFYLGLDFCPKIYQNVVLLLKTLKCNQRLYSFNLQSLYVNAFMFSMISHVMSSAKKWLIEGQLALAPVKRGFWSKSTIFTVYLLILGKLKI